MAAALSNTAIVTMESFDPSKLSFGEPETLKLQSASMNKIPIKYEGKDLVIQTPVFQRCTVRTFDKKNENDKGATVMYQSIQYQDEEDYAQKVIEGLSDAVKSHVRQNVRSLFNRKKDNMTDLSFSSHIQEPKDYCASIKTVVPTVGKDGAKPAGSVRFYRDSTEELTTEEFTDILADSKKTVSARALISVPYAYTLSTKGYGFKTFLCTLDLKEKPEGVAPVADGDKLSKEGSSSAGSNAIPMLGNAFL